MRNITILLITILIASCQSIKEEARSPQSPPEVNDTLTPISKQNIAHSVLSVSYTHLTLPTNREV